MELLSRDSDRMASAFLEHTNCPDCGSSDALAVYDDGHSYCFACQSYTPSHSSHAEPRLLRHPTMERNLLRGHPVRLRQRGLSDRTCQRLKIHKDDDKLRFHYCDSNGAVIGAKVKTKDKDFYVEGNLDGSFFGQHLCPSTGKRIVITEGELDAASCLEVAPTWPVVSLPTGAAGAKRAIQKNLQFLQGYDEVVLFFDNDDQEGKLRMMLLLCSLLARLSYASLQITRTHLTAYKQETRKLSYVPFGTRKSIARMESLMGRLSKI